VLVVGFPTGAFQANCYLIAPGEGEACLIIDPGQDAEEPIAEALRKHRLSPVAVLLTHGHFDHVFAVAPVCDGNDIPAWIHPEDRELLSDPLKGLSLQASDLFGGRLEMREPTEVRELSDGAVLDLAGLSLTVDHTPGHTRDRWSSAANWRRAAGCSSPATPSSPARSAVPICPAGTRAR